MNFTPLTSLSIRYPYAVLHRRASCYAELSRLRLAQAQVDQPSSRHAQAWIETEHTTRVENAPRWIN